MKLGPELMSSLFRARDSFVYFSMELEPRCPCFKESPFRGVPLYIVVTQITVSCINVKHSSVYKELLRWSREREQRRRRLLSAKGAW